MRDISKDDIIVYLKDMMANCDGAIMVSNSGDMLNNFAITIKEKLNNLCTEVDYCVVVG